MARSRDGRVDRRQFLKGVGAVAGAVAASPLPATALPAERPGAHPGGDGLALVRAPDDEVASSGPARWASDLLRQTCESRGLPTRICGKLEEVGRQEICVLLAGSQTALARSILEPLGVGPLDTPESQVLAPARHKGRDLLLATASDARGLTYALTELLDRVAHARKPRPALQLTEKIVERPACRIRSVMRLFVSDVEDKAWFHDRSFWPAYLDMLVRHRFNRFNLAFGIGYDFARQLRDTYFYFPYPFLLSVPGHDVRAVGLRDEERDRNLETLRFVGEEVTRRGLQFRLGLWTHAFEWADSPEANYTISGLNRENQAAYCRDAVRTLLQACPSIHGLTLRTHGESGVPEGDAGRYEFWQALFGAIAQAGRTVEIDLHAKGVDQRIVDLALATGLPVSVSPKFWAEHMGLPYLQSSIRALELPTEAPAADRLMALSTGTRNHMRYSYGDLLMEGRRYGILHRVWPGTQRLLLWGDPAYAAQMGRTFSAFGADGVEFMEPLAFKGRKGSGLPGDRDAYLDASLHAEGGDWRKYDYTYRLWGRLAYNPDSDPEVGRRPLRQAFGPAAESIESGLARSSRILPLITSAHCPSAANNNYWPELYSNMSMFDAANRGSYSDTPAPRVFGTVSSLDPQLFASIDELVESLLRSDPSPRITPVEVARQLDEWASSSATALAKGDALVADRRDARYRRVAVDCAIAGGLGRFFARKLRAGVLFGIFDRTGFEGARAEALRQYREARSAWAAVAQEGAAAYVRDITFGFDPQLRGHWQDRLAAIDRDIAAIETRPAQRAAGAVSTQVLTAAIAAAKEPPRRPAIAVEHIPLAAFPSGQSWLVGIRVSPEAREVRLHYRHLNQAETYRTADMKREGALWHAAVPADYTRSPYPLQYYFEVRTATGVALWPGFKGDFLGQPYLVLSGSANAM